MFFRRKPKAPLSGTIGKIQDAVEEVWRYKRDKTYMPTEEDIKLLDMLATHLLTHYATVDYIARSMRARVDGTPANKKGAAK